MIDMIFNSFKIKYALMDQFIEENELKFNNKRPVNIFINFDCIMKSLANKEINDFSNNSYNYDIPNRTSSNEVLSALKNPYEI
jgi:hypothetical protein